MDGPILICMNRANIAREMIYKETEDISATDKHIPEVDSEAAPLDLDVNKSFKENWLSLHRHRLHPSQELRSHFLRRMYNTLEIRNGEAAFVNGVYTMASKETPVLSRDSNKGRQVPNQYVDLVYKSKEMDDALLSVTTRLSTWTAPLGIFSLP